nr:MAG TPA: hypothetical protein [Caudoviricetes sp.]
MIWFIKSMCLVHSKSKLCRGLRPLHRAMTLAGIM